MNICLYSLSYIRENEVSYCIKDLCNLSLEIQGPFTHSLMHAHLPDNMTIENHSHLIANIWLNVYE